MNSEARMTSPTQSVPTEDYGRLQGQWFVACPAEQLRHKPLAITLLNTPLVVFRHSDGIAALVDRCPHRGAPLSAGVCRSGVIACPYHGWQFDANGICVARPGVPSDQVQSQAPSIQAARATEQDGWIWIALAERSQSQHPPQSQTLSPLQSLPRVDFVEPMTSIMRWQNEIDSDWLDAIENLLDATHTPFVHAGLVRDPAAKQRIRANLRVLADRIEVKYSGEGKQAGWISRLFERERSESYGRFLLPCVAQLEYRSKKRIEFALNAYFTPTLRGRVLLHTEVLLPQGFLPTWLKRVVLQPFLRRVLKQDMQILRLQQQNISMHPPQAYCQWEGDLIRGWIQTWLRTGRLPEGSSHEIELEL